jgi:chromodomain-helicase-DNA-binding protein 7
LWAACRYYRALYSQQIGALLAGVSSKNLPGMRNLAMELRKLCCHPVSDSTPKE